MTSLRPPSAAETSMAELLPSDVLTDILSRLPANSVASCRCVCKLFLNLTTRNHVFSELQFTRSLKTFPRVLIEVDNCGSPSNYLDLFDPQLLVADGAAAVRIKPTFPLPEPHHYYSVVNSCNGLICLAKKNGDPRLVYNPITGEYAELPKSDELGFYFVAAICHCSETNRFKVLRAMVDSWLTEIIDLGADSWRIVELGVPSVLSAALDGLLLNGIFHWSCGKYGVVTFDFKTERFGQVSLPAHFVKGHKVQRVSVFGDCLSVSDFNPVVNPDIVDIWVMKEYGIQQSWTKQFVIDISTLWFTRVPVLQPIDISNGKLLMADCVDRCLICYDLLDKSFRFLKIDGDVSEFMVYIHTPSFASLENVVAAKHVKVLHDCSRSDQGDAMLKQYHNSTRLGDELPNRY